MNGARREHRVGRKKTRRPHTLDPIRRFQCSCVLAPYDASLISDIPCVNHALVVREASDTQRRNLERPGQSARNLS